jgi:hypothetical protein
MQKMQKYKTVSKTPLHVSLFFANILEFRRLYSVHSPTPFHFASTRLSLDQFLEIGEGSVEAKWNLKKCTDRSERQ